jgi:uncharacterized protein (DUF2236 family)
MSSYFDDRSQIMRVQREHVVALAGGRTLLMQSAHPLAFEGFFAATTALGDPYARLRRTADVIDTIVFGERAEADRQTARVRHVHRGVRGRLAAPAGIFAAGTRWAADDPDLLLWIIATLADSGLVIHERYVGALSPDEREAYWHDYRVMGALFGLEPDDMPTTFSEFEDYLREMLEGDTLCVTPAARQLATAIVLRPPVPLAVRPLLELAKTITVGLLPETLRHEYRLSWDPLRGLAVRAGSEYSRRILLPILPRRVRHRRPAVLDGHGTARQPSPSRERRGDFRHIRGD